MSNPAIERIYKEDAAAGTATLTLGSAGLNGVLVVEQGAGPAQSILLSGTNGAAVFGGKDVSSGSITLTNKAGIRTLTLAAVSPLAWANSGSVPRSAVGASPVTPATGGYIALSTSTGVQSIVLDGATADVTVGGDGRAGRVDVTDDQGNKTISLDGQAAAVTVGGKGKNGDLTLTDAQGNETMIFHSASGNAILGGSGQKGQLTLKTAGGKDAVTLEANTGQLTMGGNGVSGDVVLRTADGSETVSLGASGAALILGGNGLDGGIELHTARGAAAVQMDGSNAKLTMGVPGVKDGKTPEDTGVHGEIVLFNHNGIMTIKIGGGDGDITFFNGDVAEEFDAAPEQVPHLTPGVVAVLDADGRVMPCERPYDGCLAGVIAGAGRYQPGIVLDRKGGENRVPVALAGKTYCWVDAEAAPVKVGDLLTTSSRRGFAMPVLDRSRALGSVIGKALQPLASGTALIPVLVKPQ